MSEEDSGNRRRRLDSVIPELLKRAVEIGVEKAVEAPDNLKEFVGGMKLPREAVNYLLAQVDETKNGLFRVVAKEVHDFLEHTNLAGEMQKMLTTVQFEISTTIRFKPNDGLTGDSAAKIPKPEVKADVQMKRSGRVVERTDANAPPPADDRPRERRRNRE
ncbi:MAG TPA: hypothetical protein VHV30_03790 [Polyangiaceae bacterium]|jgi:hypothetical protein|nr:hypothetical protein [Polyangiaceae bacterium]